MAQWIRICLPMQRTHVGSLVQEDFTFPKATEPQRHNEGAHMPQLLKPSWPRGWALSERSHRSGKSELHNEEQPVLTATGESPHSNKDPTHANLINQFF